MSRVHAGNAALLVGIVIAALGMWLSRKVGNPHFDPSATLVIGMILVGAAFVLARKSHALLMGDSSNADPLAQIREILNADTAVEHVGHLETVPLGADNMLLTTALCFKRSLNPQEVEQAIVRLERSVKQQHPAVWQLCLESVPCKAATQPAV